MSSSTTTIKTVRPKKQQKSEVIQTITVNKKKKKNGKRKSKNRSSVRKNFLNKDCYADLLNDPFRHAPCRMGFGTMVPTETGTVSYRSTHTANADGSFACFVIPSIGNNAGTSTPIGHNSAGAAVATWSYSAFSNTPAFPSTMVSELRVISVGLKLTLLTAATSTPAIGYAGSLTGVSEQTLASLSPSQFSTYAALTPFIIRGDTVRVTARPVDNSAYEFLSVNYTGSVSQIWSNSIPAISLTGPASANILVEATLHFEYIPITNVITTREYQLDADRDQEKISTFFSSLEQMWDYTSARLNPTAIFDLATSYYQFNNARELRGVLGNMGGQRLNA